MVQGFDPPWRLDPLKRIVNVGWGGSIAVLAMSARIARATPIADPAVSWNAFLTAGCDDPAMRGKSLLDEMGPVISSPEPPPINISSQNDFWCYARQFSETSNIVTQAYHFVDRGKYVIFTSVGTITLHYDALDPVNPDVPFLIDFRSPPDLTGGGGLNVLPGDDNGNLLTGYINHIVGGMQATTVFPLLIGEVISHNRIVTTRETEKSWKIITFLNLPRIANRWPAIKSAGKLKLVAQMQGVDSRTFLEWSLGLATFVGTKTFVRNDASPVLVFADPDKAPRGFAAEEDDRTPETMMPTVEVTFTIDLRSYEVTATRRSL